ncbi:MAG: hypothetical protein KY432_08005 [Acidobacteria bacterium]|nr:hypothetical protein [Acidobacteriota bacterium]
MHKIFLLLAAGVATGGAGGYLLVARDSGLGLPLLVAGFAITAWATYLRRCPRCETMVTEYAPRECPKCGTDLAPLRFSHLDPEDVATLYRRNRRSARGLMAAAVLVLTPVAFLAFTSQEPDFSIVFLSAIASMMLGIGSMFAYRCPSCHQMLMRPGSGHRVEQMRIQGLRRVSSCPFCSVRF